MQRFRLTIGFFLQALSAGNGKHTKLAGLFGMIVEEAAEELREVPPEILEAYFRQAASIIEWAATGNVPDGRALPDAFASIALPQPAAEEVERYYDALAEQSHENDSERGAYDMAPGQ